LLHDQYLVVGPSMRTYAILDVTPGLKLVLSTYIADFIAISIMMLATYRRMYSAIFMCFGEQFLIAGNMYARDTALVWLKHIIRYSLACIEACVLGTRLIYSY
jgi:hypothetical protein